MILHTLSLFIPCSICYHSNSKTAIAPHLLSHTLNIFICSACGWPPTPVIIFQLLSSLFEPPVPLKKTSSCYHVITINFLKQLECFSWSFSKTGNKFQVDRSLFDAHPSHTKKKKPKILNFTKFLQNDHKESALTEKRAKKNVVVTECWNLVFETIRHCDIIESNAFFLCDKSYSCSMHNPVTFQTRLVCCSNGLHIIITFFQHRNVHKYIWYWPSMDQKSVINFCNVSSWMEVGKNSQRLANRCDYSNIQEDHKQCTNSLVCKVKYMSNALKGSAKKYWNQN